MIVGAHVKREDPLAAASATGSECVQIFLSDPQSWKKPEPREDVDALKACGMPVFVHAPYIVNLASPDNRIRIPSRKILQQCCDAAATINATAVIVHGGHVGSGEAPEEGFARWLKALDQLQTTVPVYLENTAGGDHAMARHFDTIAGLWDTIGHHDFLGFCLDTCHTHAAGEETVGSAERILEITGRIDLVHCNDSKDAAGSGRDRHENLGSGQIAMEAIVEVVKQAGAPVICETPFDGIRDDIVLLRESL